MQWWCAATNAEWTWTWRPYPGVWLALVLILAAYLRVLRRPRSDALEWRPGSFAAGFLLLWICLDWPVGALGAGYLLTAHTAQYVILTLAAVPLLIAGVPPEAWPDSARRTPGRLLHRLTHPVLGLLGYALVMAATHFPVVTDTLMGTQAGSFGIDLAWLTGGFALWWPVLAPDEQLRMSPPVRIGYLFLATIPPTIPAAFMVFADYPIYALYELAPRVHGIAAATDQQVAGVAMKAGSDPLLWIAMAIVFFRWHSAEERAERLAQEASA